MKILIVFLLGFLFSCTRNDPWHYTSVKNSEREYDLSKISYPASSPHHGMTLELIRQGESIDGYLCVTHFEFPKLANDPHKTKIYLISKDKTYTISADRLQGGQRLHFDRDSLELILDLMHSNNELTIQTGHFSQVYETFSFEKQFQKLTKFPPRFLPDKFVSFEFY